MGDALLLFNISRPRRLIELSNVTQMASRTLAENSRYATSRHGLRADGCDFISSTLLFAASSVGHSNLALGATNPLGVIAL